MTSDRPASHNYLEQLQRAAYSALGHPPPNFSAEELRRREAESLQALQEGGTIDLELRQKLNGKGLDPTLARSLLENQRQGVRHVASHHDLDRILSEYEDAPTPYVDPFQHAILKQVQLEIQELPRKFPRLSFAGELERLRGRVTLSTLPTGQPNARIWVVPRTDQYLIVVDPVFFDLLYNLSNNFASSIDSSRAQQAAQRYAESGQEQPLREAIRYGDPTITQSFFYTLSAFLGWGLPPPPQQYNEEIVFTLAEHLRKGAIRFIVAHEYAHILLGHLKPSNAPQGHHSHGGPSSKSWNQEREADWLACGISDSLSSALGLPPPVRFMGAYFFFISDMVVRLSLEALKSGHSRRLMDFIQGAEAEPGKKHPVSSLRIGAMNSWLQEKYPPYEFRGTQYFAALLSEVADSVWHHLEPHIFRMRADGFGPPAAWTGFDIYEHS